MIKVIGVRFRTAGKIYFFDPLQFEIKRGDHVIVETARGIEYGTVMSDPREVEDDKVVQPLKPVIRLASQRDCDQEASNKVKEREAFRICQEKIKQHGLDMKLIDAEYTFDNNKVLFYFTADGRIDFRELVKDLASIFKTRIELRQIGVRDETKLVGGIGICGRPLCCHSYLSDFIPVSIKMAKEQNLSLNPAKISGVCGRLMCCLKNEEETYEELNRRLPSIGDMVTTEEGLRGEVQSVNVLRQQVKVVVEVGDEKEIREYQAKELHFKRKHTRKERMELSKEELEELERLEKEDFIEVKERIEVAEGGVQPENTRFRGQSSYSNRRGRSERPDRNGSSGGNGAAGSTGSGSGSGRGAGSGERRDRRGNRSDATESKNGRNEREGGSENRTDRRDRQNRSDHADRTENRTERGNRTDRTENRSDRNENRADRGNRPDRTADRNERNDKNSRTEKQAERPDRGNRPEQTVDRANHTENTEERGDRPNRRNRNRNRRPNRQNKPEGNPKSNDSEAKG